jgi:hypothetical protein
MNTSVVKLSITAALPRRNLGKDIPHRKMNDSVNEVVKVRLDG